MAPTHPATIAVGVEHEFVERKSRFLARVEPVSSVAEADAVIAAERKRWWDARHHCSAMVTGLLADQARSSDDGEPSGTAGVPMLEVLRRRGLTDVVAVVSRYFGGVKLGAGGLVRAYSTSVSEALDLARVVQRRSLVRVSIEVSHAEAGRFDNLLRDWTARSDAVLGDTAFETRATLEAWVPPASVSSLHDMLATASGGAVQPVIGEERIVDIPETPSRPH
ncbi:YigZ family protein [Microbacterium sp. SLBN-146]|uniref:IMPACT family protein n=1 Tax=Microbacterium sp. SLBN-146 TaxID=2768457 RepID=UPI00114EE848|nr:YigZ family protein [Microbacterium sp. SLBN-146]TQJ30720.1 putative YigZ family protein [Microbacterium sp. SLBN-146]